MKAPATAQRLLLEVADVDAEIARLRHLRANLPEQAELDAKEAAAREAKDAAVAADIDLEDRDRALSKLEAEVDSIVKREERDAARLAAGGIPPKQLSELDHEVAGLKRRRWVLEDELLEAMEAREQSANEVDARRQAATTAAAESAEADQAVRGALEQLDITDGTIAARRAELAGGLPADLLGLYEQNHSRGSVGAGLLRQRRCGACRMELDRGTLSRIAGLAEDDVTTCDECNAILVRTHESGL